MGFTCLEQGLAFWGPVALLNMRFTFREALTGETGGRRLRSLHFYTIWKPYRRKKKVQYEDRMPSIFTCVHNRRLINVNVH